MMRKLLITGLLGLLIVGCAVSPNPENTLSGETMEKEGIENTQEIELPGSLLFDFGPDSEAWFSVDDNVMGGISSGLGRIQEDGTLLFSGTMSLENNGGFSSIRSPYNPIDLSDSDGLLIRVLGDGKIYRMRIWSTATGGDIAYNSFFETQDGQWVTVYIPFETMVATFRGFQTGSGPLDPGTISSVGFMLSDKQPGEFALEVDWIRTVAEDEVFPNGIPASEG
jgi:hypothetical protein